MKTDAPESTETSAEDVGRGLSRGKAVGFTEDADGNFWPLYGPSPQAFARKRESAGPLKLDDLLYGIDVGGSELTFTAVAGHQNSAGNVLRKFIGLNVKATAPFWQLSHDEMTANAVKQDLAVGPDNVTSEGNNDAHVHPPAIELDRGMPAWTQQS